MSVSPSTVKRNCTPSRENEHPRTFDSIQDECVHDLVCAIIEQAVYDWIQLDYGRLGFCVGRNGNQIIYRAEVRSFFQGLWFEHLLSFALPDYTPEEIRKELKIPELPRREKLCASS